MRTPVPTVALAAVLLTSGGALAVANAQSDVDRAATETSTETSTSTSSATPETRPSSDPEPSRAPGPPPWAGQGRGRSDGDKGTDTGRGPDHNRGRGPDATGPAAYGLCQAWAEQEDPAAKAAHVPPFRNLAAAAGGVDKVDEYCAALPERADEAEEDGD